MNLLLNILWMICGGLVAAVEYFLSSLAMMVTIVGIPFGLQTLKLGVLTLLPFGKEVRSDSTSNGCLSFVMNVIWILIGGFWIFLTHIGFGLLLCVTIIGIPFGIQHFKLAKLAFTPFGKEIVEK